MENAEKMHYSVEVRDKNDKRFNRKDGNVVTDFKFTHFNTDPKAIESICRQTFKDFQGIADTNNINIEVSVLNHISSTYMSLYAYYGSEDRFLKFS